VAENNENFIIVGEKIFSNDNEMKWNGSSAHYMKFCVVYYLITANIVYMASSLNNWLMSR